jgi:hypothetical protein
VLSRNIFNNFEIRILNNTKNVVSKYKRRKMKKIIPLLMFLILSTQTIAQWFYSQLDPDTVKAKPFDMGKMWTFDNPPLDYFESEYGFRPTDEWLEKVQKSALRFGNGCSASFVSADGLIMTNHHCIRGILGTLSEEGEDLLNDGFFAESLVQERKVPKLFVLQLMLIKDVTNEVLSSMRGGKTDSARVFLRDEKIEEIKTSAYEEHPELEFRVVSLYYGGKYSLYGYKRYRDIRLVFVPELWVAKLGGDYDNFTYPRYGLDCAFLRAYNEEGDPINTDYFFSWGEMGIEEYQPVFVVGNPGSTNRIYTVAQLEYLRDYKYGLQTPMRKDLYAVYEELVEKTKAKDTRLVARLYSIGNGLKVYSETYKALLDPYFMARKKDFEDKFKSAVKSNPNLNEKYGNVWEAIVQNRKEEEKFAKEKFAYTISHYYSPKYFSIAQDLVELAEQLKLLEDERKEKYTEENIDSLIENIFPENFDSEIEKKKLLVQVNLIQSNIKSDSELLIKLFTNKTGKDAAEIMLANSKITSKESVVALAKSDPDEILNSTDPFIFFIQNTQERLVELNERSEKLAESDAINNQLLGEALYRVYGNSIPPDATFTLRISDGIVKGFDYNGTRAPYKTTFYGSLDRYYSFDKKFPFNLPSYWEDLPEEFVLSTPLNFVSTNDIIGGNSGSPVINKDAEIVGLAFDGNIESHSGRFIYTTEANRTVSVSAEGMIEAIRDLYNAERLSDEILSGGISD